MKVKVGDKIYDGENEPVMVILSKEEKEQIADMSPDATTYCIYPSTNEWTANNHEKIRAWMNVNVTTSDYKIG